MGEGANMHSVNVYIRLVSLVLRRSLGGWPIMEDFIARHFPWKLVNDLYVNLVVLQIFSAVISVKMKIPWKSIWNGVDLLISMVKSIFFSNYRQLFLVIKRHFFFFCPTIIYRGYMYLHNISNVPFINVLLRKPQSHWRTVRTFTSIWLHM